MFDGESSELPRDKAELKGRVTQAGATISDRAAQYRGWRLSSPGASPTCYVLLRQK